MKKLVSGVLVLLAAAAAAFFILKVGRFTPERLRATELAPAETIFLFHAPNLQEAAKRFRKTGLFAIWQEPEVQEFMQKPRRTAPPVKLWEERLARLARVAPGEVFVAVTSMDEPQPRFVAGFSFAGKRRAVEELLAEPRGDFKRRWPSGTSSSASHKGAAIEVFTFPGGLMAECFVRNWYFLASDTTLLRATLDRYEKSAPAAAGGLNGNDVFLKATEPLGSGSDFMLFGRFAALGERLGALMPGTGLSGNRQVKLEATKIQAIAAATRIEGPQMRDTVFILNPGMANDPPLSRNTLALGGAETFLYFATGIASLTPVPDSISVVAGSLPGVGVIEKALAEQNLAWSDFGAAFGPEIAATLGWPDDAALPAILLGFELRDAVKARSFIEAITRGAPGAPAWERREEAGVAYYSAPTDDSALSSPTIAITPRFALFGFSADAVTAGLQGMETARDDTAADSPFQKEARQLASPALGFGYLDLGAFFERAYRTFRPALTMSLALSGDLGDYVDAGKLPPAQTFSKHLTPSVFSQTATPSGTLIESAGTLTFNQLIVGMIAGAATTFPTSEAPAETVAAENESPAIPAAKPSTDAAPLKPVSAPANYPGRADGGFGGAPDPAIPGR